MLREEPADLTPEPKTLDYFAANEPQRKRDRGVVICAMILLLSWGPYLCGIVNASTVARSYLPEVTQAHRNGSIIGFLTGVMLSGVSLIGFVKQRHLAGMIAAAGVFLLQLSVVICLGVAS